MTRRGPVTGWTLGRAEDVRRITAARQSFHPVHARKVAEDVDNGDARRDADFQRAAVQATNTDLSSRWFGAAEHGEGCREDFLAKRSKATHAQKI